MNKTFWNIWTSYATYYFGKVNLSIVIPALLVAHENLSVYSMGLVTSAFFFAYAIGQFLHGQISERYNPFNYIVAGLILSGVVNMILGFSAGYFIILVVLQAFDGFFQSMGWSSCVRANSIIQSPDNRERSSIILGTSYQFGNSFAWLISAFAVGAWGWEAGFWVASIFLLTRGFLLLAAKPDITFKPAQKMKTQIRATLSVPILLGGLSLCFLNMVRYGVITWIPLYLFITGNYAVAEMGKVGLTIFLIPIAGILGTLTYNKIKTNNDLLTLVYLMALAATFVIFPMTEGIFSTVVLLTGSFFLYGPHVFLVTTLPHRLVDKQVVAASTGFIDGMGYVGATLIGIIVPFLLGPAENNWAHVFEFWAATTILIAILVAFGYTKTKNIGKVES